VRAEPHWDEARRARSPREYFGPLFVKFCSYFPYNAKLYINKVICPLEEVLLLCLLAVLAGAETFDRPTPKLSSASA
jgi:hypothetical protein